MYLSSLLIKQSCNLYFPFLSIRESLVTDSIYMRMIITDKGYYLYIMYHHAEIKRGTINVSI